MKHQSSHSSSSAPRLLIVSQYFSPDINATSQIVKSLTAEISCQVNTCVITNSAATTHSSERVIRLRKAKSNESSSTLSKTVEASLFTLKATLHLLCNSNPHEDHVIVFSNPPFAIIIGAINHFFSRTKFSFVLQDIFPETAFQAGLLPPYGPIAQVLRLCFRMLLPTCENVFVLSDDMKLKLSKLYPNLTNISVIPNWAVQSSKQNLPSTPRSLRQHWGIPNHHLIIQYSGNLGAMHDLLTLLETARLLANEPITFLFIGKGVKLEQVLKYRDHFQLSNINVQPLQPFDLLDLSLLTSDMSVVSLASGADNLVAPSKLYGILKSARPVLFIGSYSNEIKRQIDQENIGVHVSPGDSVRLARILSTLNRNRHCLIELGANAQKYYKLNYSVSKSAFLYLQKIFPTSTLRPPQ